MTTRRELLKSGISIIGLTALFPVSSVSPVTSKRAMFFTQKGTATNCLLCPRLCELEPGDTGICRTRKNIDGSLLSIGYANPCAVHVDPIEKKPLYHVLPGSKAFSIAVAGCNLKCKNCQNYSLSQVSPLETRNYYLPPQDVVDKALTSGSSTIAYTYSEPTAWYEYMYDTAKLARKAGLKNLMITCGYINQDPLKELCKYMDAANIDLKSFRNDIYRKLNAGKLQPVLDTIKTAHELGTWVEITNLLVPKWTDDFTMIKDMCKWIKKTVGPDVPLHFSRFYPMYKLAHLYPTPSKTLAKAKDIAHSEGLHYVYVGNVAGHDTHTLCPSCGKSIIKRNGYLVTDNKVKKGKCSYCQQIIAGIW